MKKRNNSSFAVILSTALKLPLLSLGLVAAVAASVGSSLLPPLLLAKIIDSISAKSAPGTGITVAYFALLLLSYFLESAKEGLLVVFGQKCAKALRTALCSKLYRLDAPSLTSAEPGAVVSRFVGDVDTVEKLFTSGIIGMASDLLKMAGILIVIATKCPGLLLILAPLLPLIFIFTRKVQKKNLKSQLDNREALAKESSHIPQTIRSLRTVRNTRSEDYMTERYDSYVRRSYAAIEKSNFFDAVYSPIILIINALTVAAVMLLASGGNASVQTLFGVSVGTAVALMNYVSQIFGPIESLGMELQTVQSAVAGVRRINEFLRLPERDFAPSGENADSAAPAVEFSGTDFSYDGETDVLKNFELSVKSGEQLTLEGRTGAGKSTVFKLILGLYPPTRGSVKIFGMPADAIPDSEKRKIFGYVEQSFRAVPGTVGDQITLGDPEISHEAAVKAAELAGIADTVNSLPGAFDAPYAPEQYSQGQKQLLSVARAIASDPKILLLDEITANLDAETEKCVLDALARASSGRTVISISHRLYLQQGGRTVHVGGIGN